MVQSIILTGPTAVGKSSLAIEIAETLGLEIINADSVCFYRHFNIGSAKPSPEELAQVKHHLIDVADPNDAYHAGQFFRDCMAALDEIHSRGKRALIVGGSGFYLKALRYGLWEAPPTSIEFRNTLQDRSNPELHEKLSMLDAEHAKKVSVSDRYRLIRALEIIETSGKKPSDLEAAMDKVPNPAFQLWVVDRDKTELQTRMTARIELMMESGLVEETESLRIQFPESKVLTSVGYAQVMNFLNGSTPAGRKLRPGLTGLKDEIELAHRQLAKQQRTWFKNLKPDQEFILDLEKNTLKEKLILLYQ
jgi:tRNA dimethylallyltransferase